MRRLVVITAALAALGAPAVAPAFHALPDDGTLVVRNGSGPAKVPVAALTITGTVIGNVDHGRIVIDDLTSSDSTLPSSGSTDPEVTGAEWHGHSSFSQTAQIWGGTNFKFRAAGGRYTILVYGSGVDLVAIGHGTVSIAGSPDTPSSDGQYSLNGADFRSLPSVPLKQLSISANNG